MLKTKSFLCGDFGAGTLKIAEFEPTEDGSLRLKQYATRQLGLEGAQDANRAAALLAAVQALMADKAFGVRVINICAAGFNVFSKFVKLPPVDTAKVTQIIQYEAQQNVPFPLEEVVWDYQILGTTPTGELEVLLVAIKVDVVEGLFTTAEGAGLSLQLVDVSPAALCNAFRFNYGDEEGCTMLLDIGAKTSNLLFFEKGKVYSRSINIGGNAITQDFASESKLSFAEAETVKVEQGFVSLGGAYEEPENQYQAQISKIARQVMTRLHIQMNQTIQHYRSAQGGSVPQRLYLAGGASLMPYTAQFFAEKLNIPVDYFNPLRNVQLDEAIDLEEIAKVAHTFGEVVGLAIRNLAQCPVELNLMPKSYLKRKQFRQKQPYFIATVFSLVLVVFAYGWFYDRQADIKKQQVEDLMKDITPLQERAEKLNTALQGVNKQFASAKEYKGYLEDRSYWPMLLTGLHDLLIQFEQKQATALSTETGVWIESFKLDVRDPNAPASTPGAGGGTGGVPTRFQPVSAAAPTARQPILVYYVQVRCRAMNLARLAPDANAKFAFAFEQQLKTNDLFAATNTKLLPDMENVDATATTFGFGLILQLKRPVRLY